MYRKILNNARLYSSAAWILSRNSSGLGGQERCNLIPSQVMAAFSLELYFKALFYILNGKDFRSNNRRSHDISKIFNSLEYSLQQKMINDFDLILRSEKLPNSWHLKKEVKRAIPLNLESNLKVRSKILTRFRHPYEVENENNLLQIWFSREIEDVVKKTIFEIKPELRNAYTSEIF
jgi:hypothetical protein